MAQLSCGFSFVKNVLNTDSSTRCMISVEGRRMMNWDWKDYFIAILLGVISILAFFTLVDWMIVDGSVIGVEIVVGFVGAIVGGLASGLLTLLGVRLTIKDNNDKQIGDSLPKKLLYIEDIILILNRQKDLLHKSLGSHSSEHALNQIFKNRINYILEYLEDDGLLSKSANVNLKTYQATRRFYNALKKLSYEKKSK